MHELVQDVPQLDSSDGLESFVSQLLAQSIHVHMEEVI